MVGQRVFVPPPDRVKKRTIHFGWREDIHTQTRELTYYKSTHVILLKRLNTMCPCTISHEYSVQRSAFKTSAVPALRWPDWVRQQGNSQPKRSRVTGKTVLIDMSDVQLIDDLMPKNIPNRRLQVHFNERTHPKLHFTTWTILWGS